MEDKERANMVLKRIGEMPYFDAEAIINVLVNEFTQVRKEAAQQNVQLTANGVCENCGNNCWKLVCETCGAE